MRIRPLTTLSLLVALCGCLDFRIPYESCVDAGRCPTAGGGGGGGGGEFGAGGGSGGGAALGGGSGGGGGPNSDEQLVVQTVTRYAEDGTSTRDYWLDSSWIKLLVRNDSTFTEVSSAVSQVRGRCLFTGVPAGQRYLFFEGTWIVDPPSSVDISYHEIGRGDVNLADGGVRLKVSSSGMKKWVGGSALELVAPNAGLFVFGAEGSLPQLPAADSSPSSLDFDYAKAYTFTGNSDPAPLIDTTKGDVVYLTQLESSWFQTVREFGVWVGSLVDAAVLSPLTMGGGASAVGGTFTSPPAMSVSIDWKRSAFRKLGAEANPKVVSTQIAESCFLAARPYGAEVDFARNARLLVAIPDDPRQDSSTDVTFIRTVGNPYPANWPPTVFVEHCAYGPAQSVGGSAKFQPSGCAGRWENLAAVNGAPLTPLLSPPKDLKINGQAAYESMNVSGTSPTVSWAAPAQGTVDAYVLNVFRIVPNGLGGSAEWQGEVVTKGTSVMVPPGLLQAGQYAYLALEAENGLDRLSKPWMRTSLPQNYAAAFSGVLHIQ